MKVQGRLMKVHFIEIHQVFARDFAAYVGRVIRLRADEELRAHPRLHN